MKMSKMNPETALDRLKSDRQDGLVMSFRHCELVIAELQRIATGDGPLAVQARAAIANLKKTMEPR